MEEFRCGVCFEEYDEGNIYPLISCEHIFHNECLAQYLNTKIKDGILEIKCPEQKCDK